MKSFSLCLFTLMIGFHLFASGTVHSQSAGTQQRSDQLMIDLLKEVRLLRTDLRRLSASSYRAHTMIERLRVQQAQVNRLSQELNTVRDQLTAVRSKRSELKGSLPELQKRWENGLVPEAELTAIKTALTELDQREPELTLRESQLSTQLNLEREALEQINAKLDAFEQEMLSISAEADKKP